MKILIVDDDPLSLQILRMTLESTGHEVESATNGREAMQVLRKGDCRAVISDWEMPEMNGIELCKAIRSEDLSGYVYIILLTGHNSADDMIAGLEAGADDFLSKPFNPSELAVRLRTAVRIVSLETRDVAIFAMAKLAESRDPETGAHLERVRSYSRILAEQLLSNPKFKGIIDPEYVKLIYMTSPLHDIGKVGIPDSVLLKPGRLTDREFVIMKSHTTIGAETLDAAIKKFPGTRFLEMARNIAVSHHEWLDGSGYPRGLVGEQIPLCGRIVALADVYDALSSRRVYKGAFSYERANGIITGETGKHFDTDVVEAYLARQEDFIAIRDRYSENEEAAAAA